MELKLNMRREKRRAEFEERYFADRDRLREKRQRKNSNPSLVCKLSDDGNSGGERVPASLPPATFFPRAMR